MDSKQSELHETIELPNDSEPEVKIPYAESKFKQQKVPACKPFLTPLWAAVIYGVFALISMVIGASIMASNRALLDIKYDYSDCNESTCNIEVEIPMKVSGDLLFYYQLDNFHQNHFAYAKSKSWEQLKGLSFSNIKTCKQPDVGPNNVPCGALPMSVFNDTFKIADEKYTIVETGIAQKEYKKVFKNAKNQTDQEYNYWLRDNESELFPGGQTNEHFINWIQINPLKTVRKLFGFIKNVDIEAGTKFNVTVTNNYPIGESKMKKNIVLAQTHGIGGKNAFFGYFFIVLCFLSLIISVISFILYCLNALPLYRCKKEQPEFYLDA